MGGWDRTRWSYVMATLAAAGLAWWTGYRNEVAAVTAAGKPPLTFRSAVRHVLTPKAERDAVKRLEAMRQRAGRGELTPSESAESWRIIRNFSEEQVKAYLADLPRSAGTDSTSVLTYMLFHRWAQLTPETAAREATKDPDKEEGFLVRHVLCAWMARDRDGAERWAETSGSDYSKMICGLFIGRTLVREDPLTAPERAEKEHPEVVPIVFRTLAWDMGATAESRQAFLALRAKYGGMKGWDHAIAALASAAAQKDPENLLATLKDTGLPPEQALQYRSDAMKQMMYQNPEIMMDWTLDPASAVPMEKQASLYVGWVTQHPKEATEWAVRNGRQDFIADSVRERGTSLMRSGWEQWTGEGPQNERVVEIMNRYQAWRAHDASAAEAWADTMPADIRDHLNRKTTDATQ